MLGKYRSALLILALALVIPLAAYFKRIHDYSYVPAIHTIIPRTHPLVGQGMRALAFSPDDRHLAVVDMQDNLRVLQVSNLKPAPLILDKKDDHASTLAWLPGGEGLIEGDPKGMYRWMASSGKSEVLIHPNLPNRSIQGSVQSAQYIVSPSGAIAAGGFDDKTLKIWDLATGKSRMLSLPDLYASQTVESVMPGPIPPYGTHTFQYPLVALAFSPDSHILAVSFVQYSEMVSWPRSVICLYDTQSGKTIKIWYWGKASVNAGIMNSLALAFSPDGSMLASEDDAETILWKLPEATQLRILKRKDIRLVGGPKSTLFVPGTHLLVSASSGDSIELWNADSGQFVQAFHGAKFGAALAVSHDGNFLASGGQTEVGEGTIDIWNIRRLKQ